MSDSNHPSFISVDNGPEAIIAEVQRQAALLKTGALQNAILNSANFSIIATDEKGIVQLFNIGAERMLGYTAAEVETTISPGFEALAFKAPRGIEDIYELTYVCKDGSRLPAIVSITSLCGDQGQIIGYLLIGTDNTARKQVEDKLRWTEESFRLMVESVSDCAILMLDPEGRVVSWNSGAQRIKDGDPRPAPVSLLSP